MYNEIYTVTSESDMYWWIHHLLQHPHTYVVSPPQSLLLPHMLALLSHVIPLFVGSNNTPYFALIIHTPFHTHIIMKALLYYTAITNMTHPIVFAIFDR